MTPRKPDSIPTDEKLSAAVKERGELVAEIMREGKDQERDVAERDRLIATGKYAEGAVRAAIGDLDLRIRMRPFRVEQLRARDAELAADEDRLGRELSAQTYDRSIALLETLSGPVVARAAKLLEALIADEQERLEAARVAVGSLKIWREVVLMQQERFAEKRGALDYAAKLDRLRAAVEKLIG